MKTITSLAIAASKSTPRAEFLATIAPDDRGYAAAQFDRAVRFAATAPATEDEIQAESQRIAETILICDSLKLHGHESTIGRWVQGRIMPASMDRNLASARAAAHDQITGEDIAAARPLAMDNLNLDRTYLAARLGIKLQMI